MKTPSTLSSLNKFRKLRRRGFILASSLIVLTALTVIVFVVQAASATWSATPTSSNWVTTAGETNWSTGAGTFPGSTAVINNADTATFTGPSTQLAITINSATLNIKSITFSGSNEPAYTIGNTGGNSLFLTNAGTISVASSVTGANTTNAVNAPLVLEPASSSTAGSYTFSNAGGTASHPLVIGGTVTGGTTTQGIALTLQGGNTGSNTISGVISDGGAASGVSVTKDANGTWILSGANNYTGGTTLASATTGTLKLSGSGTLGATSGSLTVNSGTLDLNGTSQGVGNLTGSGGTILNNATGTNVTLTIGNNNATGGNYQGVIANNTAGTGTVALTKTGAGTITLSGANTYTGLTTVSGGTLKLNRSGGTTLSTSDSVTINGGTLEVSTNQTISNFTMTSGTLLIDPGVTLNITGTYNVTGGTINNQGTINLNGSGNTSFPGSGVTVNNGTANTMTNLTISQAGTVTLSQSLIISGTLSVTLGTFDQGTSADLTAGTISVSNGATLRNLGTGDLTIGAGGVSNAGTVTYNANGLACGDTDDILIRSDVPGTQRSWTGAGTYSFTDVDVKDQSATPPITVRNGTDSGNNTGWVFISACATAGQTYTWTPLVGDTNWQNPLNWNPNRVTPSSDDVIVFNGTVTPSPTVTNVPTQTIGALQLINNTSVMMSTNAANTLTISSGTSTAFSIPSGNSLTLQGASALRISLTSGSVGTVGGTMILQDGAHQLTATTGGIVTFNSGAIFTTAASYSATTNPFGTGTGGNGSNNSIIFASGSNYFHNNGGSPFGTAGSGPVVVFQTGSTANWLTSNGFQASGRTYANLVIGNPSTQTTVSDSGTGNFQFDNLTVNSPSGNNSTLTFTGSGASTVTIQGDITSTGAGTGTAVSDVTLTGGTNGIVLNNVATHTFSDSGNTRTITFGSNANVDSGATLTLQRNLLVTPYTNVLSIRGTLNAGSGGYVIGSLLKPVSGNTTFEVGTANGYSPASLSTVTGSGDFTISATQTSMPGLDPSKALHRFWTLKNGTPGITSAILTFNYLEVDVFGNEANYRIAKYSGTPPATFPEGTTDNVNEATDIATTTVPISSFSDWSAAEPNAVTAVKLEAINALGFNNGNLLKWQTGFEVDNLGFNVYRMTGGKLVRITPSIVAGSALLAGRTPLTAGLSYTWFDSKGAPDSAYYVEDIDLNGTRTMHGPVTPEYAGNMDSPSREQAMLLSQINGAQTDDARFVTGHPAAERNDVYEQRTVVTEGATTPEASPQGETLPSNPGIRKGGAGKVQMPGKDDVTETAPQESTRETGVRATINAPTQSERASIAIDNPLSKQRSIAAGAAVKIAIRKAGWYRVTQAELVAAGLNPNVNPNMLQLYADGVEQPILVSSSNNKQLGADAYLEFYGTGIDTLSSDTRTYWLITGNSSGKRINGGQSNNGSNAKSGETSMSQLTGDTGTKTTMEQPTGAYSYTVERKDKIVYFNALLNGDADNFFGPVISKTAAKQDVALSNVDASSAGPATLELAIQGVTMQAHKVRVVVNGFEVGVIDFSNVEHPSRQFQIPSSNLVEGNNSITLASLNGDSDINLVDYMRLTYLRTYRAVGDQLTFNMAQTTPLLVEGFTTNQVRVFDITNPDAVTIVSSKAMAKGNTYTLKIAGGGGSPRTLLAVADSQAQHPTAITANDASNLSSADNRADFIILTHRSFLDAVKPLADLRRSQGLETAVVNVEDVYDEFSYGAKSPAAIKEFIGWARDNWALAPRYVLFVGDASYDPRNYQGFGGQDLVPTRLVDATSLETSSDDALADFDGDGIADLSVGRLPVQTAAQAEAMIGKIVNYSPAQTNNSALLVSDHLEGYDFEAASNQLKSLLPQSLTVTMVNRGNNSSAQVKTDIINGINSGPLVVNYAGHGSTDVWTGASILSSTDAAALTNGNRLPLFVSMTCLNGRFQDSNRVSLAEALMKAAGGGGVAVWASSGLTEPDAQSQMDQQLMRLLFADGQSSTLGDAVRGAKHATNDMDVRRTWILFGDPTMRIR